MTYHSTGSFSHLHEPQLLYQDAASPIFDYAKKENKIKLCPYQVTIAEGVCE